MQPPKCRVQIYALIDPRNGRMRYVGKTENTLGRRLRGHVQQARQNRGSTAPWIQELLAFNLRPLIVMLEDLQEPSHWPSREAYWISTNRAEFPDLLNIASGGQGPKRMRHDSATRDVLRAHTLRRYSIPGEREKTSCKSKAFWESPGARTAQSIRAKAQLATPEARATHGMRIKAAVARPDVKQKTRESLRKYWSNQAVREIAAEKTRMAFQNGDLRARQSEISRQRFADVTVRLRISETKRAQWRDPEFRARMQALTDARVHARRAGGFVPSQSGHRTCLIKRRDPWTKTPIKESVTCKACNTTWGPNTGFSHERCPNCGKERDVRKRDYRTKPPEKPVSGAKKSAWKKK